MDIELLCLVYLLYFVTHSVHSFMYLTKAVRYNTVRSSIYALSMYMVHYSIASRALSCSTIKRSSVEVP